MRVPKANQTNIETIETFKSLLADSVNQYIRAEKIAVENCSAAFVKFLRTDVCPTSWGNANNCMSIQLAIPLRSVSEQKLQREEIELTTDHLRNMWILYGREKFKANGFPVS